MDNSSRKKINKKIAALNDTRSDELNRFCRTFHLQNDRIHILMKYISNIIKDGTYVKTQKKSNYLKKIQSYKASFQPQSYETRNQLQVQNLQKSHFYGDK